MYCCFKRAPSFPWSMLKEIAAAASPVENIFTGTETRPNDRVADPMECALMVLACAREGPMIRLHPYGRKTEARSRSARDLPRQAVAGPHAGARCGWGPAGGGNRRRTREKGRIGESCCPRCGDKNSTARGPW